MWPEPAFYTAGLPPTFSATKTFAVPALADVMRPTRWNSPRACFQSFPALWLAVSSLLSVLFAIERYFFPAHCFPVTRLSSSRTLTPRKPHLGG